jgi:hypothetical protein
MATKPRRPHVRIAEDEEDTMAKPRRPHVRIAEDPEEDIEDKMMKMDLELPTPSDEGSDSLSDLKPGPLNFSRPLHSRQNSRSGSHHDRSDSSTPSISTPTPRRGLGERSERRVDFTSRTGGGGTGGTVRGISAFHEPNRDTGLPDEPRFSLESEDTESSRGSENSAASEFAWDGQLGELKSKRRPMDGAFSRSQRYEPRASTSHSARGVGRPSGDRDDPLDVPLHLPGPADPPPPVPPQAPGRKLTGILKRPGAERVESSSGRPSEQTSTSQAVSFEEGRSGSVGGGGRRDWEDDASHHTVSVDGDGGYVPEDGEWTSSDYDTSQLSASELKKLKKKGINPALYLEMREARKGRGKWVGPLVGNTYIG